MAVRKLRHRRVDISRNYSRDFAEKINQRHPRENLDEFISRGKSATTSDQEEPRLKMIINRH